MQAGYESYLIIGEQSAWDTPVLTASMKQVIYELMSASLKNSSSPVIPTRFRRTPSPARQIENFMSAGGDIVMNLHAEDMLIWWKHVLMATASELASTDFTAQEVFGNGAGAAKAFFVDQEECFGDGNGAGKAKPASGFSLDTQPSLPAKLTFTLDQADSGVFTIVGTDGNGAALTEVLTFTADLSATTTNYFNSVTALSITYTGFAVATTLYIEANNDDTIYLETQPAATTTASDPGKMIFTFNGAKSGTMTITGTEQNGDTIEETLTFDSDTTQTTTKYFQTVTSITYETITASGTLLITSDKNTWTHVLTLGNTVTEGLTMELVKGALPSTYVGCLINQGTINIADVITMTASILAKRGWNRAKVPASGATPTATETPTVVSGYSKVEENVYVAWQLSVYLNSETATPVASADLVFNNQLTYPRRYRGLRTEAKPVRSTNRELALNISIDYEAGGTDFDETFYYNQTISNVIFEAKCTPHSGPEYIFRFTFPRCEITQFPDPDVSNYAEMTQGLALRPVQSLAAVTSDEASLTIVTTEATP